MYRIIISKLRADYKEIIGGRAPYDYGLNHDRYSCIEVDSETLCFMKLKYRMHRTVIGQYSDIPTYAISQPTQQ